MQRGLDWRWRSFGAVAARVELLRGALAEALAGRAARIGYEDSGRPSAVALDLAIQAAGACAAPLPAGLAGAALDAALAARSCSHLARFEPRSGEAAPPPAAVPAVSLPRHEPPEREAPPPTAGWGAGAVQVAVGGVFEEISAELLAAADRFAARLAGARERRGREILVLPRPLHDPAGRRLAAWALAAGAALVLEPDRGHLAATAAWVRPTVFAGAPDEIAALRAQLSARRRRGLPLGRLHTVAVLGGAGTEAALPEAERRFWRDRGTIVAVV